MRGRSSGPLAGLKVVELAGLGPGPLAAMLLADLGADVVRVERARYQGADETSFDDVVLRNRPAVQVDLKHTEGVGQVLALIDHADALIEGFRPGVMERLGLGPDVCLARNPKLIYGRITGWGQAGPLAQTAGHDINYIALAGVLGRIGREAERPVPPLNLIGDYGGGALYLAFGIMCGLFEAQASGKGQVIDAAMVDGAASLLSKQFGLFAAGQVNAEKGTNLLDGGAYFYDTYECADGRYIALGSIEEKFHDELLRRLAIDPGQLPAQYDPKNWSVVREVLRAKFLTRTRDAWCELLQHSDACVTPVLSLGEAPDHPHAIARESFVTIDGVRQPAPAPRFSRTPAAPPRSARASAEPFEEILGRWKEIRRNDGA